MRLVRWTLGFGLGMAWSAASGASAETLTLENAPDLERFRPALDPSGAFALGDVRPLELGQLSIGMNVQQAIRPLQLVAADGTRSDLVASRLSAAVSATVGLGRRWSLGATVPVLLQQSGSLADLPAVLRGASSDLQGSALGDLRLTPRYLVADEAAAGVGALLEASVSIPTGQAKALSGDERVGGQLAATVGKSLGAWLRLAGQTGVRLRPERVALGIDVGNELLVRAAAIVSMPWSGVVMPRELVAELDTSTPLSAPWSKAGTTAAEWRAGVRFCPASGLSFIVGGGTGLSSAYGTPAGRVMATLGWDPRACGPSVVPLPVEAEKAPVLTSLDQPDAGAAVPPAVTIPILVQPVPVAPVAPSGSVFDAPPAALPPVAPVPQAPVRAPTFGAAPPAETLTISGIPTPSPLPALPELPEVSPSLPAPILPVPGSVSVGAPAPTPTGWDPKGDTDGDGVTNIEDTCPAEKGTSKTFGCKVKPQVRLVRDQIELADRIRFTAADELDAKSRTLLDELIKVLAAHPELTRVRIEGHTAAEGDAEEQKKRSRVWAQRVKNHLADKGVSRDRLELAAFGGDRPIAPNLTAKGRDTNRRVEFAVAERNGVAVAAAAPTAPEVAAPKAVATPAPPAPPAPVASTPVVPAMEAPRPTTTIVVPSRTTPPPALAPMAPPAKPAPAPDFSFDDIALPPPDDVPVPTE